MKNICVEIISDSYFRANSVVYRLLVNIFRVEIIDEKVSNSRVEIVGVQIIDIVSVEIMNGYSLCRDSELNDFKGWCEKFSCANYS